MKLNFERDERNAILALSATFAVLLSFWNLFQEEITAGIVINNLLFFFASMLVAVFLHELGHKLAAHYAGYDARIVMTGKGLLASILIALYTFGRVPIITPNRLKLDADTRKRMDKTRTYDNPAQMARVAIGGIIGSVVAVTLFRALLEISGYQPLSVVVFGTVLHAAYSMIPFELLSVFKLKFSRQLASTTPSDGMHIVRASAALWIFVFAFIVFFGVVANIAGASGFWLSALLAAATTGLYSFFADD